MARKIQSSQRREESLSRDQIVEAAIALLDAGGESGLTFRALADKLATGPGAIYWHIDNKSDLLTAACDAIIARTINAPQDSKTPDATIRSLALAMFDAIDVRPWVGSALARSPTQTPMVRIIECLGQHLHALGVLEDARWATVSALLNYILGVGGQNAANTEFARRQGANRSTLLNEVSISWSQLDPKEYPFTRSIATQMRDHDDRADFLTAIDLILAGIQRRGSPPRESSKRMPD